MRIITQLDGGIRRELQSFLASLAEIDGEFPLSEYKELHLDGVGGAIERVALERDGSVAGYAQAAWHRGVEDREGHWAIEVAVAPGHRRGSLPRDLIRAQLNSIGDNDATLWAPADYVEEAVRGSGWRQSRLLLRLTCSLPASCHEDAAGGFSFTTFRPGTDEGAWLEANNLAFAGHPENGALTLSDLEQRIRQPWFDPNGFFLAWDGRRVAGSCWTKVHEDGVGEIYVVGVVPAWEGRGLGTSLICHGLDYLHRTRGLTRAKLYTESGNERAARLYERLGFTLDKRITAYAL